MIVERVAVGPLEANCWVAHDGADGPAVVVDPGADAHRILAVVGDRAVAAILLTHAHFDHIGAVDEVRRATGAPLYVHPGDADRLHSDAASGAAQFGMTGSVDLPADHLLSDGEQLTFGGIDIRVLHTPGHSPGCVCLLLTEGGEGVAHLLSGDTLFAGSVGRTDFPGGDARALSRSIATKLAPLPGDTIVHPGHGPDSTVERESRINPFWPRA